MDRLKQEIETARKEQAEVKAKHKWAMDAWVKLSKDLTSLAPGDSDHKKKEKECENQAQLVKQLADTLHKTEVHLDRLTQNLLFFFEENLMDTMTTATKKKPAAAQPKEDSEPAEAPKTKSKEKEAAANGSTEYSSESSVKAFRKHLLGYCHGSHGVGEDAETWKEKLPGLIKRAEKKLPEAKVAVYRQIAAGITDVNETRKKLILWYVDVFPNDRKPQGYYEAAGLPLPKKKIPGAKKSEDEDAVAPTPKTKTSEGQKKSSSSSVKPTVRSDDSEEEAPKPKATPKAASTGKGKKPAPVESSSEDSSSESEEEPVKKSPAKKQKMSEEAPVSSKKKEETPAPKKKEVESAKKKKEEEVTESARKHHHHHKKSSGDASGKAARKSRG